MRTINCIIRLHDFHAHPVCGITPTEALVLRALHAPDAPTEPEDPENPYIPFPCIEQAVAGEDVDRTDRQELARLKFKYNVFSKKTPNKHVVEDLFPGSNPKLPESFKEIGLRVDAPEPAAKPVKKDKAEK